jgi:tetratricopeptide (TPR) repeat protein
MLERGLSLCDVANIPLWFPRFAAALGSAYALSGNNAKALPLLEQAVEQAASMKIMAWYSLLVVWLSEAYLLAGRMNEAIESAERAFNLSRDNKARGPQAWAHRLLGDIAMHRDPPEIEEAETSYQQALAIADELGMRPLQAHCHRGLGTLYNKMERVEQARTELSTAIKLYSTMEMTFWLPQAEAALG